MRTFAPHSGPAESRAPHETGTAIRPATARDAPSLYQLITANLEAGHLLPRSLDEATAHAARFLVATDDAVIVGCGELAPLSQTVVEIRSLAVDEPSRGAGLGSRLVRALTHRARLDGFPSLCAFTHEPSHFVRLGFSIVPHVWFPDKISTDCHTCPWFRRCGQYAMLLRLATLREAKHLPADSCVPHLNHDRAN